MYNAVQTELKAHYVKINITPIHDVHVSYECLLIQ